MKINNEIKNILVKLYFRDAALHYLLSLYYKTNTSVINITEEQKRIINRLGIVDSYEGVGIVFKIPLFEETTNKVMTNAVDYSTFIHSFIDLFPQSTIKTIGYNVRSDPKSVADKLKTFVKDFNSKFKVKYDDKQIYTTILQATKNYIEHQRKNRWQYTMKCHLFIHHKDKGSELYNWVVDVLNNNTNNQENQNLFIKDI